MWVVGGKSDRMLRAASGGGVVSWWMHAEDQPGTRGAAEREQAGRREGLRSAELSLGAVA